MFSPELLVAMDYIKDGSGIQKSCTLKKRPHDQRWIFKTFYKEVLFKYSIAKNDVIVFIVY